MLSSAQGRRSTKQMQLTEQVVRDLIQQAVGRWNDEDMRGFVECHSTDVVAIGSKLVTGHDGLFHAYIMAYPSPRDMGVLQMEFVKLTVTPQMATGVVKWSLRLREKDESGHAVVSFVVENGYARIAYDQTTPLA